MHPVPGTLSPNCPWAERAAVRELRRCPVQSASRAMGDLQFVPAGHAAPPCISMNVGGDVMGSPMSPQAIIEEVRYAEAVGFPAVWSLHFSRGVDALCVLAAGARGGPEPCWPP